MTAIKNITWDDLEQTEQQALRHEFQEFDMDHNGLLEKHEVKIIVEKRQNSKVSDEEVEDFFKLYDQNCDGKISWDEFVQVSLDILNKQVAEHLKRHESALTWDTLANDQRTDIESVSSHAQIFLFFCNA